MVSYTAPTTTTSKSLLISRLLLLAVLAVAAILYVAQISVVSTRGYDISALRKEIQTLETEQERLAVEIAKHSSITSVESRLAALNLVPVDRVDYLSAESIVVARR
ncbi:MAG: hypothetical protein AAB408_05305 [Patescibacteria group bacterium]